MTPTLTFLSISSGAFNFGPPDGSDPTSFMGYAYSSAHQSAAIATATAVKSSGQLENGNLPFNFVHQNAGFQAAYTAAVEAGEDEPHAEQMAKAASLAYATAIRQGASDTEALILATAAAITGGGMLHGFVACGVTAAAISAELAAFAALILELASTAGSQAVAATLAYLTGQSIHGWGLPTS